MSTILILVVIKWQTSFHSAIVYPREDNCFTKWEAKHNYIINYLEENKLIFLHFKIFCSANAFKLKNTNNKNSILIQNYLF